MINSVKRKSHIARKLFDWSGKLPRIVKRFRSIEKDYIKYPPVMVNSFPKSGTHLLFQFFENSPMVRSYGTFLPSIPSIPHRIRSKSKNCSLIRKIVPGELLRAHLHHEPEYLEELKNKNVVHYFIYRDLRDVAVSEALFLTYNFRWHSLHRYYKALPSDERRISFCILGAEDSSFPYFYPNIVERFKHYEGWLKRDDVFSIRYEDLRSNQLKNIIKDMKAFYDTHCPYRVNDDLFKNVLVNISPINSHTYRKGQIGGWKDYFSEDHKLEMKRIAGKTLIELGYEKNSDW